jgi:hypothetical protein
MTTEAPTSSEFPVCQTQTKQVPRQPDGDAFFRIYSGGVRAAETHDNVWQIEPVLMDGQPCAKGFMQTAQLGALFRQHNFTFIAFHRIGWYKGNSDLRNEFVHWRSPSK